MKRFIAATPLVFACVVQVPGPESVDVPWYPGTLGEDSSSSGESSGDDHEGSTSTSSSAGESSGDGEPEASSSESSSEATTDAPPDDGLDPPAGGSSGGAGGGAASGAAHTSPSGVDYRVIAPGGAGPHPLMIVFSGTEGGDAMTSNLLQVASFTGTGDCVFAVIDGWIYNGDGAAGVDVLDDVRAQYDIDNDRTYLLSESAGTSAGLELAFALRPSYFAAYWANDVNASATPSVSADELGFAPWGNAGPGGDFADADAIVGAMRDAGYRIEDPAPYDGTGADSHGSIEQFLTALTWFPGKQRS
jgi:hypothetical protein